MNSKALLATFNAQHKAGALTVANFLLSPQAQAHKQDLGVWGDTTVLEMSLLDPDQREAFARDGRASDSLPPLSMGETLREPDPSWTEPLEQAWRQRYGAQ